MKAFTPIEAALAMHAIGALADAEAAYRRILAAAPRDGAALHHLGVLLHQRGRTQDGFALIRDALDADGGSASRYNDIGNIHVQTGNLTDATTAFRSALDHDASDANIWNNLGAVLYRQREYGAAEDAYRRALSCDGNFVPALENMAALLVGQGREVESAEFTCRAFVLPPLAGKSPQMLGIAYYSIGRIAAAADCYRAWLHAEPDNAVARHYLAACSGENVPTRASDDFVTAVFDDMAASFDAKLVGKLTYRGPEIVAALLDGNLAVDGGMDILDGGCGTGLCAHVLAPRARRLVGVDLSCRMLDQARERDLYSELVVAELTAYLAHQHATFDVIVMADTVIYFGALANLFASTRQALRRDGLFVFTVEPVAEDAVQEVDFRLFPSGRYGHSRSYLWQMLAAAGFVLQRSEDVFLRMELGRPLVGIGVLARVLPQ